MFRPQALLLTLMTAAALAQDNTVPFSGLGTPADGSVVYFASALRLKGTDQPLYGKLFVADTAGIRLLRSLTKVDPPQPVPGNCNTGDYFAFLGADVSSDGRIVAAPLLRSTAGSCTREVLTGTDLISGGADWTVSGIVHLSADGRTGLVVRGNAVGATLARLDIATQQQSPVTLPVARLVGPGVPASGRVIADDRTVVLVVEGQLWLIRPGGDAEKLDVPLPLPAVSMAIIDAAATKVIYSTAFVSGATVQFSPQLRAFDLATKSDRLLADDPSGDFGVGDDGSTVVFVRSGQLFAMSADGSGLHAVTTNPDEIRHAVLSGNGKISYVVTSDARLVRINIETGDQTEIIGRTPYLQSGAVDAGMIATAAGAGLSETTIRAIPPLPTTLGNMTVWLADRKVPIYEVGRTYIRFLIPWNTPASDNLPLRVEGTSGNSPFDAPEAGVRVTAQPRAGAIARQNWDGFTYVGPVNSGEIIHVWAVGLGAVSPDVPDGAVAPSAEPLARLSDPLICSGADVLYAGLAPGYLERVYQVDIRLNTAGYHLFSCTSGGKPSLALTLYVVQ